MKTPQAVLIIDGASLLRLEVFTELHIIAQFEADSEPYLPIILSGQSNLVDKLIYRASAPLASRIIARSHLGALLKALRKIRNRNSTFEDLYRRAQNQLSQF